MCQLYGCLFQGEDGLKVLQVADGLSVLPLIMLFHHSGLNVWTCHAISNEGVVAGGQTETYYADNAKYITICLHALSPAEGYSVTEWGTNLLSMLQ